MFPGFSSQAISFLRNLKRNNEREWFQPRKEIFETQLKAPMTELVEAVNRELLAFAPDHVTDPKKAIYRIYRDTRFSADKTPYKTHIGAIFPHHGLGKQSSAGFYFHVSTKSVGIAAGSYMPGPDELRAVREWLAENHVSFRKAAHAQGIRSRPSSGRSDPDEAVVIFRRARSQTRDHAEAAPRTGEAVPSRRARGANAECPAAEDRARYFSTLRLLTTL
jgi:uncharacterized protein (TIGR02453 family)